MPDTAFSTLMDKVQNARGETQFHVPDDWMQGRTAYGGLVAAKVVKNLDDNCFCIIFINSNILQSNQILFQIIARHLFN